MNIDITVLATIDTPPHTMQWKHVRKSSMLQTVAKTMGTLESEFQLVRSHSQQRRKWEQWTAITPCWLEHREYSVHIN